MIGPLVDADQWHAADNGDGVRVELHRGGFLVARLDLDRVRAVLLVEDVREVIAQLDWRWASWLRVRIGERNHVLVNSEGWGSAPTLCGRRPASWRGSWLGTARPVLGGFYSDDCAVCRRSVERQSKLAELAEQREDD